MWYLFKNLYDDMKSEIEILKTELEFEKILNQLLEGSITSLTEININLQKENNRNRYLLRQVDLLERKIESMRKTIYIFERKGKSFKGQIELLNQQNKELITSKRDLNKQIINQKHELSNLSKIVQYYSRKREHFHRDSRERAIVILKEISNLLKKLLLMGKYKKRKLQVLYEVKEKLSLYEDVFYEANVKLDEETLEVLLAIENFITKWIRFYRGDRWCESVEAHRGNVGEVERLLRELYYISNYKSFFKYKVQIVDVPTLYLLLKQKNKLSKKYGLEKFKNEIQHLYLKGSFDTENFIVPRIYPGKLYLFLPAFKRLEYNFELLKTYERYNTLYFFGDVSNGIYKVGVTKNEISIRFKDAIQTYVRHFNANDFEIIKTIKSFNASNLETYIKQKYKHYRHPLFKSTEWFLLDRTQSQYFLEDLYYQDSNFMKIYNYHINIE